MCIKSRVQLKKLGHVHLKSLMEENQNVVENENDSDIEQQQDNNQQQQFINQNNNNQQP